MYQNGQKVVCIDDDFDPWVFDLFTALPKKNSVYTVRAVKSGRSNPSFIVDDDANLSIGSAEFDILILLEELINPEDPHSSIRQELGFRAERFAPLEEDHEEEEELELVGFGREMSDLPGEFDPVPGGTNREETKPGSERPASPKTARKA